MKAILGDHIISSTDIVLGGISAVFWTLTLLHTIKYVISPLIDNHGEVEFCFICIRKKRQNSMAIVPAIIGGSALLADGIITPPSLSLRL
jgi:KUP system potassium uptake protein